MRLPEPFETIFAAAMIVFVFGGFVVWFCTLYFIWKTISNRKPNVFRDDPFWNPVNIVFRGDLLTEKGLEYRRKMVRSVILFAMTCIAAVNTRAVVAGLAAAFGLHDFL